MDLVIPDKLKKLEDGAIEPWTKPKHKTYYAELKRHAKSPASGFRLNVPYCDLTPKRARPPLQRPGTIPWDQRLLRLSGAQEVQTTSVRVFVSRYRGYTPVS